MNILIVTYARFPEGDAESVRLHTLGKLLRDIGHSITYVGMGFGDYLEVLEFDGFAYSTLRKKAKNKFYRLYYYLNYKNRLRTYLHEYLIKHNIHAILFADLSPRIIDMLKRICRKNDIQLITDSMEWYSPEQFKYKALSPEMILKNIENKYSIDKTIKVISISKYLYNHFINKGCNCVRIPVILDVVNMIYKKNINPERLTILYAGSPGKKDYVSEMLRGVLLLEDHDANRLRFVLAGVNINDCKNLFTSKELGELSKYVEFLGRVERKVVLEKLSEADFTVLLRSPDQRYAKAGFPTKVVESLASATPVILNLTSDLGDYINNLQEGLIVDDCSAISFAGTLKYALKLSIKQRDFMRNKARVCAENNFDYRRYKETISSLLENKNG